MRNYPVYFYKKTVIGCTICNCSTFDNTVLRNDKDNMFVSFKCAKCYNTNCNIITINEYNNRINFEPSFN